MAALIGGKADESIKLPMPPGTLYTLWHNEADFEKTYLSRYPGYYLSGDAGYFDADGYASVMTRIDDIINVAGHRLSTGQMEQVLAAHPDVAEAAVVGAADDLKGQVPVGLVVLKSGVARPEAEICTELVVRVREEIGAVADFKHVTVVARLPKTRSGKVLRVTIRTMADGVQIRVLPTIEDEAVLPEISAAIQRLGYPKAVDGRCGRAVTEAPKRTGNALARHQTVRIDSIRSRGLHALRDIARTAVRNGAIAGLTREAGLR